MVSTRESLKVAKASRRPLGPNHSAELELRISSGGGTARVREAKISADKVSLSIKSYAYLCA